MIGVIEISEIHVEIHVVVQLLVAFGRAFVVAVADGEIESLVGRGCKFRVGVKAIRSEDIFVRHPLGRGIRMQVTRSLVLLCNSHSGRGYQSAKKMPHARRVERRMSFQN